MFKIKKIKNKLWLAFGLVLVFSMLVSGWAIFSIFKIIDYGDVVGQINHINMYRLELRRAEKNFLLRDVTKASLFEKGDSPYLTLFRNHEKSMHELMDSLAKNQYFSSLDISKEFDETQLRLKEYSDAFFALVEKVKKRGFKDWGDEGELRKAIHAVEKDNVASRELILDLRKNEKDFFLRKDLQYVEKFDEGIETLKASMAEHKTGNYDDAVRNVATYREKFHQIVEAEKAIGLNEKQGLIAQLQEACDKLDPISVRLGEVTTIKTKEVVNRTIWMIVIAIFAQLSVGTVLAIGFSKEFTKNTTRIRDNIVQLSQGQYPEETEVRSIDEFGESQRALNNLIERVKTAATFAGKIGNGELTVKYDERFGDDVLAKALITMHEKLKVAAEEDEKRSWATQGLADFGELLRKQDQDVEKFADHVLSFIVKYSKSNQGRLYVINEDSEEKYLKLISAYAWDKKKYLEQKIMRGEGLAGQCWQEREPIYMTQVPENYILITSGLGYATPRNIFILPLKINEDIYGVIELASLKKYEDHERELIVKLTASLASAISTVTINERTKTLLAQTQQQTEEMRAQEEEMRQNMEELSATQEEMSRKEQEYLRRIEELEMKHETNIADE
jgi:hypothetical protein